MVLFRCISLRERWARHRPTKAGVIAIAVGCIAAMLILDRLAGGPAQRMASEAVDSAWREIAIAKCVERLGRAGDSSARLQKLRRMCASRPLAEL